MKLIIEDRTKLKFLVDAMLGKLSRFLRIFGYDTVYANDLKDNLNSNPIPDDKLKQYAKETNRIIITKDSHFYNISKTRSIFLQGEGIYNYLNQLKNKLDLIYEFDFKKARCSVCNSPLEKVNEKKNIKKFVLEETYKNYSEFYQCISPKCKKVFWNGPHILDITTKLKKELNSG